MSKILILLIKVYQKLISPLFGRKCRFYPTCSSYAIQSLKTYGFFYGSFLAIKRILRCHPYNKGGYDPVPKNKIKLNKEKKSNVNNEKYKN